MCIEKISPAHKIVPLFLQTLVWFPIRFTLAIFGRYKIYGKKNLKDISQAIFAVNHTSEIDPAILTVALSPMGRFSPMFYVVAPIKIFRDSKFRWRRHIYKNTFFRAGGAYAPPQGLHDYATSLAVHTKLLKLGHSLCIFPEGKMTETGELGNFHGGVIHLARESGVPIIPVAITGVYKMSPHSFFNRKRNVALEFGKPIFAHQISTTDTGKYRDEAVQIFSSIHSMLEKHKVRTS